MRAISLRCVLILTLALVPGCAKLRGERVETGIQDSPIDVGPSTAGDAVARSPDTGPNSELMRFTTTEFFTEAPVSGVELSSSGPVVLAFLSADCVFSLDDATTLAQAATDHPAVSFVIVLSGSDPGELLELITETDLFAENIIHVEDFDLSLSSRFGVESFPARALIPTDSKPLLSEGSLQPEGLAQALRTVSSPT